MKQPRLLMVAGILALVAACNPDPVKPVLKIAANTTSIQAGSTSGVSLTATLENPGGLTADGTTWTITPGAGLGTLSSSSGSSVTYNPPAAVSKTETVTVNASLATAANGTLTAQPITITITPPTSKATVDGIVVDLYGRAISNVTVRIGGQSQTTRTDGTFLFRDIVPPYDAVLIYPGVGTVSDNRSVTVYHGLTADSKLDANNAPIDKFSFLAVLSFAQTNSRVIKGTVSGGSFPASANEKVNLAFGSPTGKGGLSVTSQDGSFSTPVLWELFSGPNTSGNLFGMRISQNGGAADYLYGSKAANLTFSPPGQSDPGSDLGNLALTTVPKARLEGIFNLPGNWSVLKRVLAVDFGSNAAMRLIDDVSPQIQVGYDTPNLSSVNPNARLAFLYQVRNNGTSGSTLFYKTGLPAANALGQIKIEETSAIRLTGPAAASEVDANTNFTWDSSATDSIFLLQVSKTDITNPAVKGSNYFVFTPSKSAKLPFGLEGVDNPPTGTAYTTTIRAINPFGSINDAIKQGNSLTDYIYAENAILPSTVVPFNNNFVPKKDGFVATAPQIAVTPK